MPLKLICCIFFLLVDTKDEFLKGFYAALSIQQYSVVIMFVKLLVHYNPSLFKPYRSFRLIVTLTVIQKTWNITHTIGLKNGPLL